MKWNWIIKAERTVKCWFQASSSAPCTPITETAVWTILSSSSPCGQAWAGSCQGCHTQQQTHHHRQARFLHKIWWEGAGGGGQFWFLRWIEHYKQLIEWQSGKLPSYCWFESHRSVKLSVHFSCIFVIYCVFYLLHRNTALKFPFCLYLSWCNV